MSRRTVAIGVAVATVLVVAGVAVLYPSVFLGQFGPAPLWHSFGGVFSTSGGIASEDCSVQNTQPILEGINGAQELTPQSVVVCSYRGESYQGLINTDCNLAPNGPIPSINGTFIPYDGCVLSFAPLNFLFQGLFNLTNRASDGSLVVYSNQVVLANITTTAAWKTNHCSMTSDNRTRTDGPLTCSYLGIPFSTGSPAATCTFQTPIQVNGVAVPQGGCMLQRSEILNG